MRLVGDEDSDKEYPEIKSKDKPAAIFTAVGIITGIFLMVLLIFALGGDIGTALFLGLPGAFLLSIVGAIVAALSHHYYLAKGYAIMILVTFLVTGA